MRFMYRSSMYMHYDQRKDNVTQNRILKYNIIPRNCLASSNTNQNPMYRIMRFQNACLCCWRIDYQARANIYPLKTGSITIFVIISVYKYKLFWCFAFRNLYSELNRNLISVSLCHSYLYRKTYSTKWAYEVLHNKNF